MIKTITLIITSMFILPIILLSSTSKPVHHVDWTKGVVVSYGTSEIDLNGKGKPVESDNGAVISFNRGRLNAYRKAKEKAFTNLIKSIKTIRVDSDYMLTGLLEGESATQSRLSNIISEKMKVKEYPVDFFTSGCKITFKIGDILPAIPYKYPSDMFPERLDNPIPTEYTSLVIDARGLDIEPMLLPIHIQ